MYIMAGILSFFSLNGNGHIVQAGGPLLCVASALPQQFLSSRNAASGGRVISNRWGNGESDL